MTAEKAGFVSITPGTATFNLYRFTLTILHGIAGSRRPLAWQRPLHSNYSQLQVILV
jgi:hypothetical protein